MRMRTAIPMMLLLALPLRAESLCEQQDYPMPRAREHAPMVRLDPAIRRIIKYNAAASSHRVQGLASYYSTSLNGTLTANGERYYNNRLTAAHLTLPLGCWVEVE